MKVELLSNTDLKIADIAIGTCWDKQRGDDTIDVERMERVANKFKHASTIEHLVYTFYIDGISRACLQELARHRISSFSVKSSRYTLKELKDIDLGTHTMYDFLVAVDPNIDFINLEQLQKIQDLLKLNISNDIVKYMLPEAYKTELTWTINARSLQNFLSLRTSKAALWEIRDLANAIFKQIPEDHKFLFEGHLNENKD